MRIVEPDRFHRAKAQGIHTARRHHLDRHAAFEIGRAGLPFAKLGLFAVEQALVEGEILLLRHRAVDVVLSSLVPARGHPADVHVDAVAVDDGGDGVEEGETVRAGGGDDALRQRLRGERSGRDNCRT